MLYDVDVLCRSTAAAAAATIAAPFAAAVLLTVPSRHPLLLDGSQRPVLLLRFYKLRQQHCRIQTHSFLRLYARSVLLLCLRRRFQHAPGSNV